MALRRLRQNAQSARTVEISGVFCIMPREERQTPSARWRTSSPNKPAARLGKCGGPGAILPWHLHPDVAPILRLSKNLAAFCLFCVFVFVLLLSICFLCLTYFLTPGTNVDNVPHFCNFAQSGDRQNWVRRSAQTQLSQLVLTYSLTLCTLFDLFRCFCCFFHPGLGPAKSDPSHRANSFAPNLIAIRAGRATSWPISESRKKVEKCPDMSEHVTCQ